MPRITLNLTVFFVRGLLNMIAGMLLISAKVGIVATATSVAMSAPVWVTLMIYPTACSVTLLLIAALCNFRAAQTHEGQPLMRSQA